MIEKGGKGGEGGPLLRRGKKEGEALNYILPRGEKKGKKKKACLFFL